MRVLGKILIVLVVVAGLAALIYAGIQRRNTATRISTFGRYQGYSLPAYNGSQRASHYLTLSDGTRLAYDLILPTKDGVPADQPLPVLFKYTPYGRAWTVFTKDGTFILADMPGLDPIAKLFLQLNHLARGERGRILDPLFRDRWLGELVRHGYVVLSVDRPGTGASFAPLTPGSMETASKYQDEILDWIASQPWSDGNIGMYGDSYQAMVQFAAAATGNPHLKAILPAASQIEIYQAVEYPGGVFNKAFATMYENSVGYLDRMATPVDDDPDGRLLTEARASRQGAVSVQQVAAAAPFLDSTTPDGLQPWRTNDLYPFVDRINHGPTAVYLVVGWYDIFTADMFFWYRNLTVPARLTVRPTDHNQVSANTRDLDFGAEAQRWFDYWLKGIDNGIMDEPPIHYYLQDGRRGEWRTSDAWPLHEESVSPWHFGPPASGSIASANDGTLGMTAPTDVSAADPYTVDYSTSSGTRSRWVAVEATHDYGDMAANDAKGLTYTSPILDNAVQVTGHPIVHLWLSTDAPDLDAFIYLEEVDPQGKSTYVTEGDLRASHRKLGAAPFDNLGLPYPTQLEADQEPIPVRQPFELTFALLPTSYRFHAGNRMRVTLVFADQGNFDTPVLTPAPTVQLLRDAAHPSRVELPIIPER